MNRHQLAAIRANTEKSHERVPRLQIKLGEM